MKRRIFVASANSLSRALASGHFNRKGHELAGYYRILESGWLGPLIRTCCGESED